MLGLQSSDFLLDRLYQDFLLLEMLVLRDSPVGVLVPDTPIADPFAIFFWVSTVHCDDSSIDRRVSFKIEPLSCPNTLLPSLRSSMLTLLSFTFSFLPTDNHFRYFMCPDRMSNRYPRLYNTIGLNTRGVDNTYHKLPSHTATLLMTMAYFIIQYAQGIASIN